MAEILKKLESISEINSAIEEEFSFFEDWMEKYQLIIDSGKNLKKLPDEFKIEANRIKGCQSQVWLIGHKKNGKVIFQADSDAAIVKGLISLLVRLWSGQRADEIYNSHPEFIESIGLHQHLSPTRSNGLFEMVKQMKKYAHTFQE